tara:strand:- start:484 stop:828 length:345 start_codon:yes stop_codon:yes gene_type:complete
MDKDIKKNSFLLISIGAIPGAFLRWQLDEILLANLIGCFILGLVNSFDISKKNKLILVVGFCGSITTFSGWSFHLFELLRQDQYKLFFFNSISFVLIGFSAIYLGNMFGKKLNP